jgi:hypothetical protein
MTRVVWANLTLSPAEPPVLTASELMLKVLDRIYVEAPLAGVTVDRPDPGLD